jgi:flagellar biogenesis protein FliO
VLRLLWVGVLLAVLQVGAQPPAAVDSTVLSSSSMAVVAAPLVATPAARADSLDAAVKMAALQKLLQGQGAAPVSTVRYQPPSVGRLILRMLLGLVVVLVLIYALYRMARRARGMDVRPGEAPSRALQILETSFVGPNQKVVLMRVGAERVLVVGSASTQVQTLADIQGEEARTILELQRAQPLVTPAQFSETVNQLLRRFRKDGAP